MEVTLNQLVYVIKALKLNNVQRSILINALSNVAGGNIEEMETKIDSLDKEMGSVKNQLSKIDTSTVVLELEIGDSEEVKARNLAKLAKVEHTFMADIDYGYGTADWLPATGGQATITTAEGIKVFYKINVDGSIEKIGEYNGGFIITRVGEITEEFYKTIIKYNIIFNASDNKVYIKYYNYNTSYSYLSFFEFKSFSYITINPTECHKTSFSCNATKTSKGIINSIDDIPNVTDSANLMSAFNTLLARMRTAGIITTTSVQTLEAPEEEFAVADDIDTSLNTDANNNTNAENIEDVK